MTGCEHDTYVRCRILEQPCRARRASGHLFHQRGRLVKAYVYFAAILLPVSGCAYGKIASEQDEPHDSGILHADGGVKDAKAPAKDAQSVEDVQEVPDVTVSTQCDPLPLGTGLPACDTCLGSSCCAEDQTCGSDQDCMGFVSCVDNCVPSDGGPPDQQCYADCQTTYPNGESELNALDSCMQNSCTTECFQ